MAKRKYTFLMLREYETQAFDQYLEMMAARGWFLEGIYQNSLHRFEKKEPRRLKFSVVALPGGTEADSPYREAAGKLQASYEEAGWQLQYGGSVWQVFCSESGRPAPVEADQAIRLQRQKKISLSAWEVLGRLSPLILAGQQWWWLLKNPGKGLSNLPQVYMCVVISLLCLQAILRLLFIARWYRRDS